MRKRLIIPSILTFGFLALVIGAGEAGPTAFSWIRPGTGAVRRGVTDRLNDTLSVKDFGAKGDGVANDTAAIQAAINAAQAAPFLQRPEVLIPAGKYIVSSTLNISADYLKIRGEGFNSVLIPTITNGDAVIKYASGLTSFELRDLFVWASGVDEAAFAAGTGSAQNCIGVEAYDADGPYISHFRIENVQARALKTGFKIGGFVADLNLMASGCETGLEGTILNNVKARLQSESCRKAIAITDSNGLEINALLDEGGNALSSSSTIDNCRNVSITTGYWEWNSTYPRTESYLTIGGTTQCRNVRIGGAEVVGSDGLAAGVHPITFDRVVGASFSGTISEGSQGRTVKATSNAKDLRLDVRTIGGSWPQDGSAQMGAALNYFPNSNFEMWFRGWDLVFASNCTLSQENTIVRRGKNAARITCGTGSNFNWFLWRLQGDAVTSLRGKTVRVGAWVWLPDIAAYNDAARTLLPGIQIQSGVSGSSPTAQGGVKNAWNYMTAELPVAAGETYLDLIVFANWGGATPAGTEYVVVDSITLCESSVPYNRQFSGELVDSPLIFATGINGRMVAVGSAAPTDTLQVFAAGDRVYNIAPASAGKIGWVCTSGGSPGTWKTFGLID